MNTPIYDFLRAYREGGTARLHMPGHKGKTYLGCEGLDLTEIRGADSLYEADGIIAESEANATALFGTARTVFSTEGSTQCVKAMLYLAALWQREERGAGAPERPLFLAGRNAHKAFLYGAASLDARIEWLYGSEKDGLCACRITPGMLEDKLRNMAERPAAVYVTSPDYLGTMLPIAELAAVCHAYGTHLLVDNAHGAYLHFLDKPCHPMDLGADLCCDSAHKTLSVLTGGAYLHASHAVPGKILGSMKQALALYGSTSPSYLILASLDLCNARLADNYRQELARMVYTMETLRTQLRENGWQIRETDPLRLTVAAADGQRGSNLADLLREKGGECEYADRDFLVLMLTPENTPADCLSIAEGLGRNNVPYTESRIVPVPGAEQVMSVRRAVLSLQEAIPVAEALGRICAAPTVACPPAIPVAVSGERLNAAQLKCMREYGIDTISVVCER